MQTRPHLLLLKQPQLRALCAGIQDAVSAVSALYMEMAIRHLDPAMSEQQAIGVIQPTPAGRSSASLVQQLPSPPAVPLPNDKPTFNWQQAAASRSKAGGSLHISIQADAMHEAPPGWSVQEVHAVKTSSHVHLDTQFGRFWVADQGEPDSGLLPAFSNQHAAPDADPVRHTSGSLRGTAGTTPADVLADVDTHRTPAGQMTTTPSTSLAPADSNTSAAAAAASIPLASTVTATTLSSMAWAMLSPVCSTALYSASSVMPVTSTYQQQQYTTTSLALVKQQQHQAIMQCQTLQELLQLWRAQKYQMLAGSLAAVSLRVAQLRAQHCFKDMSTSRALQVTARVQAQIASMIQVELCSVTELQMLLHSWTYTQLQPPTKLVRDIVSLLKYGSTASTQMADELRVDEQQDKQQAASQQGMLLAASLDEVAAILPALRSLGVLDEALVAMAAQQVVLAATSGCSFSALPRLAHELALSGWADPSPYNTLSNLAYMQLNKIQDAEDLIWLLQSLADTGHAQPGLLRAAADVLCAWDQPMRAFQWVRAAHVYASCQMPHELLFENISQRVARDTGTLQLQSCAILCSAYARLYANDGWVHDGMFQKLLQDMQQGLQQLHDRLTRPTTSDSSKNLGDRVAAAARGNLTMPVRASNRPPLFGAAAGNPAAHAAAAGQGTQHPEQTSVNMGMDPRKGNAASLDGDAVACQQESRPDSSRAVPKRHVQPADSVLARSKTAAVTVQEAVDLLQCIGKLLKDLATLRVGCSLELITLASKCTQHLSMNCIESKEPAPLQRVAAALNAFTSQRFATPELHHVCQAVLSQVDQLANQLHDVSMSETSGDEVSAPHRTRESITGIWMMLLNFKACFAAQRAGSESQPNTLAADNTSKPPAKSDGGQRQEEHLLKACVSMQAPLLEGFGEQRSYRQLCEMLHSLSVLGLAQPMWPLVESALQQLSTAPVDRDAVLPKNVPGRLLKKLLGAADFLDALPQSRSKSSPRLRTAHQAGGTGSKQLAQHEVDGGAAALPDRGVLQSADLAMLYSGYVGALMAGMPEQFQTVLGKDDLLEAAHAAWRKEHWCIGTRNEEVWWVLNHMQLQAGYRWLCDTDTLHRLGPQYASFIKALPKGCLRYHAPHVVHIEVVPDRHMDLLGVPLGHVHAKRQLLRHCGIRYVAIPERLWLLAGSSSDDVSRPSEGVVKGIPCLIDRVDLVTRMLRDACAAQ